MQIIVHMGDRKDETNNPGPTYTALTRTPNLGKAGRNDTIPMKCVDSSFYFVAGTFQSGIAQLTHKLNGDEYEKLKVKVRRRWVDNLQR
jgi:hypothetical protein